MIITSPVGGYNAIIMGYGQKRWPMSYNMANSSVVDLDAEYVTEFPIDATFDFTIELDANYETIIEVDATLDRR
jgi:hypothetical protein